MPLVIEGQRKRFVKQIYVDTIQDNSSPSSLYPVAMNVQIAQTYTVYCATELLDLFGDRKQMHGRYAHML